MRFVVPARIAVEAVDAGEAIAKAQLLVDATSRLRERGYDLAITGPAAHGAVLAALAPERDAVARCDSCGARRHDGEPCPSETGVAS